MTSARIRIHPRAPFGLVAYVRSASAMDLGQPVGRPHIDRLEDPSHPGEGSA